MKALTIISILLGVAAAAFELRSCASHKIDSVKQAIGEMNIKESVGAAAKEAKRCLGEAIPEFDQVKDWAYSHPYQTGALVAGLGFTWVPGIATGPLLAAAGFGQVGVAAGWGADRAGILGSFAAGAHSLIGNVAAKSAFAILQSAGMGGYGLAIVDAAAGVVAGAVAVGGAAAAFACIEEGGGAEYD